MAAVEKMKITLPEELADKIREMAQPSEVSEFITKALRFFIEHQSKEALRAELIAGYQATADEAVAISATWLPLGQEAWERYANATE